MATRREEKAIATPPKPPTPTAEFHCGAGQRHRFVAKRYVSVRFRDMYGDPMPEVEVQVVKAGGVDTHAATTDASIRVELTEEVKFRTAYGRRFLVHEYEPYRPSETDTITGVPASEQTVFYKLPFSDDRPSDEED